MRVLVIHEDGDRSDRVQKLYEEIADAVQAGSMRLQGVRVQAIHEDALLEPPLRPAPEPAVPKYEKLPDEQLVNGADLGVPHLHPGGLFLASQNSDGVVTLQPCRIERL